MSNLNNETLFRNNLVKICVLHSLIFLMISGLLTVLFVRSDLYVWLDKVERFWLTLVLFGFVGALLYFSRKCYVYIITGKYQRILKESNNEAVTARNKIVGYYVYLLLRPLGGIAIGPVVGMLILGGLSTLGKQDCSQGIANLSEAGKYLIMLAAFVGGYTSSDLFDALANFGKSALKPKLKN